MNNDRAERLLDILTRFPAAHDQTVWVRVPAKVGVVTALQLATEPACGSTLCAAGEAAAQNAPEGTIFVHAWSLCMFVPNPAGGLVLVKGEISSFCSYSPKPGEPAPDRYTAVSIPKFARTSLEITDDQAEWLFSACREPRQVLGGIRYLMIHPSASYGELMEALPDLES